jgi:hypothetical protein
LQTLWPGYEYRVTDGAIRNGSSRTLLTEFLNGDELCVKVKLAQGGRVIAAVKELIALEVYGPAPRFTCPVCGDVIMSVRSRVEHLNGDKRDSSPTNLKYVSDRDAERLHEILCLEELMMQPPARPSGWEPTLREDRLPRARFANRIWWNRSVIIKGAHAYID